MTKQEQKPTFYDGTKLLSLTDINREKPELYMCTTNRTGGKTTPRVKQPFLRSFHRSQLCSYTIRIDRESVVRT